MTNKEWENMMKLAKELRHKKFSKEEAFRDLVRCGLLDKDGNLTYPPAAAYLSSPIAQMNDELENSNHEKL